MTERVCDGQYGISSLFTFMWLLEMGLRSPGLCHPGFSQLSRPGSPAGAVGDTDAFECRSQQDLRFSLRRATQGDTLSCDTTSTCPQSPSLAPPHAHSTHVHSHTYMSALSSLIRVAPRTFQAAQPLGMLTSRGACEFKCRCYLFVPP